MTQPTSANSHMEDRDGNPMIDDQQSAIVTLTDSTGGAVGNVVNDTTSSVKDDIASLAGKINEILALLREHGLIAD